MKYLKRLSALGLIILLGACVQKADDNATYNQGIHITPKPQSLEVTAEGSWTIPSSVRIVAKGDSLEKVAQFFCERWGKATGFGFDRIEESKNPSEEIRLEIVGTDVVPDSEGYTLNVEKGKGALIEASTTSGIFRGMQTLEQLLPAEIASDTQVKMSYRIPFVSIKDEPRFHYRGMLVDCSRHFFPMEDLKKIVDVLSMVKINKFHWHLTDDQGWRIEIKKYPKLTEIGSKRVDPNGKEYGPFFYTQEEIKDFIQYAADRHIDVIPEIEFPGHSQAALAAYPQLGCLGADHDYRVRTIWGISDQVYCAGNDETYEFMANVLNEVMDLFPYEYIHIGGDECPKVSWKKCPKCQALMKRNGLKNEEELQSYFIHRIEEVVLAHNKKMIGWEEILEGGLAPSATVLSWIGEESGIKSANMGHDIIMSPSRNGLYIDHYQGDPKVEPMAICCLSRLDNVYAYDPVPAAIDPEKRHHVIGTQCNLWSEYIKTPEYQQYMAFPRMLALAEVGWTNPEKKDYEEFLGRLDNLLVRLEYKKVNYHIPLAEQPGGSLNEINFIDSTSLTLETSYPVTILYTTDGSDPTDKSTTYTGPIKITEDTAVKVRTMLKTGKMSDIRTISFHKAEGYAPAVAQKEGEGYGDDYAPGLVYRYYEHPFKSTDELVSYEGEAKERGVMPGSALRSLKTYNDEHRPFEWAYIVEGFVDIPEDGIYTFTTSSNKLWIDDKEVMSNDDQMQKTSHHDIALPLAKGLHAIKYACRNLEYDGFLNTWSDQGVYMKKYGEQGFYGLGNTNTYHKRDK